MSALFSEISIGNRRFRNRIVMPPMVCFGWAGEDGFVTEKHLAHYEARARGGAGLIIVEATCVSTTGRLAKSQLGIWSDDHIGGLARIASVCHEHGASVIVQIHHAGSNTPKDVCNPALAPSDVADEKINARAMTAGEIHAVEQEFVDAALRAQKAGLDGVELHGAHGYLISQFMSPIANRRQDDYGGEIGNRMRFACEIIDRIKKETRNGFICGYRMGGNEPDLEQGITIAAELEQRGVDLLHVSTGISPGKAMAVPEGFAYSWIVYCGTQIKKHVGIPVIVVNGIRTPQQASVLVDDGMADLVAVGKGMLVDPAWANKAKESREITSCLSCNWCRWFVNGAQCPRSNRDIPVEGSPQQKACA